MFYLAFREEYKLQEFGKEVLRKIYRLRNHKVDEQIRILEALKKNLVIF
jgi:hypothetical protein